MSAYSDWKCGALTYDEYRQEAEYEARRDEAAYLALLEEDDDYEDKRGGALKNGND